MATVSAEPPETIADLVARLGGIPPERVLLCPLPGTATEDDVVAALEAPRKRICELIDGVLVEKPMGFKESILAGAILQLLWNYLEKRKLGVPAGADGPVRLRLGLVRFPDVCFVSWKRLRRAEVPDDPVSAVIPELAVEILSKSNTRREIALKIEEYFRAGVLLVWVIDPRTETAEVYTAPDEIRRLGIGGVLQGGKVLPGFRLPLRKLFARARRSKRR